MVKYRFGFHIISIAYSFDIPLVAMWAQEYR